MEQRILAQLGNLDEKISGLVNGAELLRLELLGNPLAGDTRHGRLPRVESKADALDERVQRLENDSIRWKAYAAAAAAIGGVFGSAVGILMECGIRLLEKR